MNLLSIALVGFGLVAIGGGVLMATRPDQAWRVEKKVAEITGRVKVEKGEHWSTVTAFNIILLVAVGVIAIVIGLLTWR
jgi:hypothetical protein